MRRLMLSETEDEEVKEWRQIKAIEIAEDGKSRLCIDKDDEGNAFEVNELLIYVENGDTALQAWHKVRKQVDITNVENIENTGKSIMNWYGTIAANKQMMIRITPDYPIGYDAEYGGQDVQNGHGAYQFTETDTPITSIGIYNQTVPAIGTKFTIYGR